MTGMTVQHPEITVHDAGIRVQHPGIAVQLPPKSAFTFLRNRCSRSAEIRTFRKPSPGKPRKTAVATAFQLAELRRLLQTVPLPDLGDGIADGLRAEAVAAVSSALDEVVAELPPNDDTDVVRAYLALHRGQP